MSLKSYGVRKIDRTTNAIAASGGTTALTFTITYKGVLTRYLLELPIMANTPTITLTLVDENSRTIFTGAAHASSASAVSIYSIPIDVEIDGAYTVTLTPSGNSGTAASIYTTFWLREK